MNFLSNSRIMWNSLRSTNSLRTLRNFSSNKVLRDSKPAPNTPGATGESSKGQSGHVIGAFQQQPSNFDKWILVWTKKYPSKDQVPKYVKDDVLQSAMSKARIRLANFMMVFVIGLCIYTVVSSKKIQKDYANQMEHTREDYRKQITEEFRQKMAEGSAQK